MATGDDLLVFLYDDKGTPYGVFTVLDGVQQYFFYLYNAQGDVIAIIDDYAERVVNYEYSAWGELLSVTGSKADTVGVLNPFRYRGYCYDTETGLYYLNSRYYDPVTQRFLNGDGAVGINDDMSTYNQFVYCGNNPVVRYDASGMFWKKLIRGIIHTAHNIAVAVGIDTAEIGAFFLMMDKDDKGVYHASFDCWQQYGGYNDLYDFVFDLGTSMDARELPFEYGGRGYTIWAWKGDYVNLGAGAEMGIYRGSSGHRTVDKSLAMYMGMVLKYKDKYIISHFPDGDQWWITGFNPDYLNVNAKDLTVTFGFSFNDRGMYFAFKNKWSYNSEFSFNDYLGLVILQF